VGILALDSALEEGPLRRHRRVAATLLGAVLVMIGASGTFVVSSQVDCARRCPPGNAAPPSPVNAPSRVAARITVTPPPEASDVDPLGEVLVTATTGTLTEVAMFNEHGSRIVGIMTPDNTAWKPGVALGYGRTYTVTITATGTDGAIARQVSRFTTLTPRNQTKAYLATTAATPLNEGDTYGIGTVVVAHFDEAIPDRAAAQRRLSITTSPPVGGSWYWVDDQNVHWRPQHYFAPGTVVSATANVYGIPLGHGLYGQEDSRVTFRIGDAHLSVADDETKRISVYNNGVLVRTMPTSMGMGGTETIGGRTISFWTQRGTYTVMDKANPVVMDSSTFGLPINSRLGYRETIKYATRISTDGVYLHELGATVWAQGNTNVTHGCLNLNRENAQWFYEFSQPGDIVEVRNTGGEPLQLWQNGDWTMPWHQWLSGSALS
jgi:lipoprotein-anchoring transpeptidase ErfK/SrfK